MATIELEHSIGFSGSIPSSIYHHPNNKDYIYASAGCIVICDLNNPHKQEFLRGHDDDISCIALSKSGKYIISGQFGMNADVCVWDFHKRTLIYRLNEHNHGIANVAINHDEKLLVTIGDHVDKRLIVWDMSTGNIVASTPIQPAKDMLVCWGTFVKDIKRRPTKDYQFATASNKSILIWKLDPYQGELSYKKVNMGSAIRDYTALKFSDDTNYIYAGTSAGELSIIYVRNETVVANMLICSNGVLSIEEIPQKRIVVVGGGDGTIMVLEGSGKDLLDVKKIKVYGAITSLHASPDGENLLAGSNSGDIYMIKTSTLQKRIFCQNHRGPVKSLTFPMGVSDKFATCSTDGSVRYWDLSDYSIKAYSELGAKRNPNLAFPTCVTSLLDLLLTGWSDGSVWCIDTENGEFIWNVSQAHRSSITCIQASYNSKFFVSGGLEGEVRVWECKSRRMVSNFKEHRSEITDLCIFKDDAHMITASKDRSIFCWDLRTERRICEHSKRMGGINSIALCDNQTQFMSVGQDRKITFWDIRQPHPIVAIDYSKEHEATCIAISPDDKFFATGGTDEVVKFYDVRMRKELTSGIGHSGIVNDIEFSPDMKQLISVGEDANIFVWNVFP